MGWFMNKSQDESRCLIFNNFVEEHGKIWFWSTNFNALFHGSIDGGIAECVWVSGYDKEVAAPLYSKIVKCGHKIIGIPMFTDNILVYDITTEKAKLIPIPAQEWGNMHTLERGRFWDGVVCGNYVFMIGFWSAKVLKFDVVNESIADVIDLYEALDIPFDRRFLSFKNALAIDSKIWIPSYVTNCIFVLNNNMQYQKIVIEKRGNGFADIAYDGEDIWLLPRSRGQFVKWNLQENKMSLYDNYPVGFHMEEEANISCIEWCNGKVYVFPYKADRAFSINKTGDNIGMHMENAFNHYYEGLPTHNEVMKYLFAQGIGKQLYSFCPESKRVLSYDTENGILSEHKFLISEEEFLHISFWKWNVIAEEHGGLGSLIKMLTNKENNGQERREEIKHNIGEKIYTRIKRD